MKAKAKRIEECTTLLEIEVPKESVEKAFDGVYDEITKIANIPGFRAGKAPKDMVKKHYAKDAKEEVMKRLIPEAYKSALDEHKIRPVGLPEITNVSLSDEVGVLSFSAKIDSRPDFKLKGYKGIKITKKKAVVTDEEIDKTIESLRQMHATFLAAEERPVKMDDYVVSDVECFVDGKPVHKKRENLWLYIEKDSTIPGLAEAIVGMKKGEEKDVELKLRDDYPDKTVAGKSARYHVKAKEIKTRKLPELDDEFAKTIGKKTMQEVREEVSKELLARANVSREMDAENQLIAKIAGDNIFKVPSSFVARQLEYMVEDAKRRLMEKGFKKEDLDKKDDEFRAKFKEDADRRVRLLFILDEIARVENIDADAKDLEATYKLIAMQANKSEQEVRDHYEAEDLVDGLKDKLREEKTIKFLLDNAQITEA